MPNYRRIFVPGGTYFITVVTFQRRKIFIDLQACELLKKVWKKVSGDHPFTTVAFCLLHDHFHCAITLPKNDSNFPGRIREIKRQFSIAYGDKKVNTINSSRETRSEKYIWQRRFWDHMIRDEKDLIHHVEYIHYNPVKHGYVNKVKDWKFSSFHSYVRNGLFDNDWGVGLTFYKQNDYGE